MRIRARRYPDPPSQAVRSSERKPTASNQVSCGREGGFRSVSLRLLRLRRIKPAESRRSGGKTLQRRRLDHLDVVLIVGSQPPLGGRMYVRNVRLIVTDGGKLRPGPLLVKQVDARCVSGHRVGADDQARVCPDSLRDHGGPALVYHPQGIDDVDAQFRADLIQGHDIPHVRRATISVIPGWPANEGMREVLEASAHARDVVGLEEGHVNQGRDFLEHGREFFRAAAEGNRRTAPAEHRPLCLQLPGQAVGGLDQHDAFGGEPGALQRTNQRGGHWQGGAQFVGADLVELDADDVIGLEQLPPGVHGVVLAGGDPQSFLDHLAQQGHVALRAVDDLFPYDVGDD